MTTSTKLRVRASDLKPVWHVIDAEGKTLGRLSSEIAVLLQGKHRPIYVPHLNTGDYVIVVNAEKFRVTGKKLEQKMYYRHSGYPGGLNEQTLSRLLERTPTRVIKFAVKGMLPKNTMGRRMLSRLKLYAGSTHPHEAQVNAGRRAEAKKAAAERRLQSGEAGVESKARARSKKTVSKASKQRGTAEATSSQESQVDELAAEPGKQGEKPQTKSRTKPGTRAKRTASKTSRQREEA